MNIHDYHPIELEGGVRITSSKAKACVLDRYGITRMPAPMGNSPKIDERGVVTAPNGRVLTTLDILETPEGWRVTLRLRDGEQLYGLGDVTRDRLDKRGYKTRMWVVNVKSYAPIPFLMSSEGWAIAVNTTFEHYFDCGATVPDELRIYSKYGAPDITLFCGQDYAELLRLYTNVSGRPQLLPKWAMGFTFVCHEMADVNVLLSDALNFRRENMPCDILGLEPGWMEKNYDQTTDKKWHPTRFPIPSYAPIGPHTFLSAVDRLGFKLSLWLCCDYDLTIYEEKLAGAAVEHVADTAKENNIGSFEDDVHFSKSFIRMDKVTRPEEPWFEHLKKFVDQGASAFKLDGAYQVLEHPDRIWGNGMRDVEAHNLYPVIYAKQMSLGFTEHTNRRSMIYSAGGYTGVQQYAATWAGDTGGGFAPLLSLLNHGLSGHSNTSCDMDIFDRESLHFGFLQPWAQLNSWNYFRHPWLLTEEDKAIFTAYDHLRYSLVPYFYTAARQAYDTGMPIMRALPLVYPADPDAYERLNTYMLGEDLLVGVFLGQSTNERGNNMYLPKGVWYDYWTGDRYEGGREIAYIPPSDRGGALFVRAGAILPTVPVRKSIGNVPYTEYTLRIWGDTARGTLYDDDGISMDYTKDTYARAEMDFDGQTVRLTLSGAYSSLRNAAFTAETYDGRRVDVVIQ